MAVDQTPEERLKQHQSSCGGMEVLAIINTTNSTLGTQDSETKLKRLMENTFGKPYSGTETWKISNDEQIFEMLEESDFESNLIETSGVMNTNIYGNTESVKTYRPKCYFTGRPASISGKAGPNEKYEKLLVCRDKNGVPHEPKRVPIHKSIKDAWREVIYSDKVKRGEIELGVSLYDEQEEQGRLPL
ncbi:uncharacterized protein METZ01_LOCUS189159 [marine metagenome]|uniref:Uncharacterized protein n=1 Tax=marine metagenome TaxID=408172 RepID=A0A382DDH4_9ZZZZ